MTAKRAGVVVVAAGAGVRFGGDKVFALLGGQPVLAHSVNAFERSDAIGKIVLVLSGENVARGRALAREMGWTKVVDVCAGGARRQDSVRAGILSLPPCDWIIVHDGARPFVTAAMIDEGLVAAQTAGAAVAAVPAKDTVKIVGPDGIVESTPDRRRLWLAQTPQVMREDLARAVYRDVEAEATDDAALLERRGYRVAVYMASYDNIKITTREDLALAECILKMVSPSRQR